MKKLIEKIKELWQKLLGYFKRPDVTKPPAEVTMPEPNKVPTISEPIDFGPAGTPANPKPTPPSITDKLFPKISKEEEARRAQVGKQETFDPFELAAGRVVSANLVTTYQKFTYNLNGMFKFECYETADTDDTATVYFHSGTFLTSGPVKGGSMTISCAGPGSIEIAASKPTKVHIVVHAVSNTSIKK